MKRERKAEILETAGRMFDETDWNAVTMRRIADTLGISVGNLTYHFKRKEDLIEAVMQARHEQCRLLPPPSTIAELDGFFRTVLNRRSQGMLRGCPGEAKALPSHRLRLQALRHIGELLSNALDALEAGGLLRREEARPALEQALLGMLLMGCPEEILSGPPDPEKTRRRMWQLLSLLLTKEGLAALARLTAVPEAPGKE